MSVYIVARDFIKYILQLITGHLSLKICGNDQFRKNLLYATMNGINITLTHGK